MVKAKVKRSKAVGAPQKAASGAAKKAKDGGTIAPSPSLNVDLMSQTVRLCQEERWREAALTCRRVLEKARNDGNTELLTSLGGALAKIECSLRRQQVVAVVEATRKLLAKEFLLDVGEP